MNKLLIASLLAASTGACKWTEFDDLENTTWVESTDKPDTDSSNWAVAVARAKRNGAGGKVAVIGASQALYSEVNFSNTGGSSVADGSLNLNKQFGIGNVDAQPLLLADPASDEVTLITKSGSADIAVMRGLSGQITVAQVFGPERPDAAAYMIAPNLDGMAGAQISQTIVAQDDKVFGTFFAPPQNFQQPKCRLTDAAGAVNVRGLGAVRGLDPNDMNKQTDDVVVLSSTGKLYIYDGGVFNGARAGATPTTGPCPDNTPDTDNTGTAQPFPAYAMGKDIGLTFAPSGGAQIIVFDNIYALIQAHDDAGHGYLGVFDLKSGTMLGAPHTDDKIRIADTAVLGGTRYVAAGYPQEIVDGTTAGLVKLFAIDTGSGIASTPTVTLHDASPEDNQSFGRGLAFVPFNDTSTVLSIAADNELFTYFRLDGVYNETRQGR